jgi:peptidoglycan hydrolase CwlO-like protein
LATSVLPYNVFAPTLIAIQPNTAEKQRRSFLGMHSRILRLEVLALGAIVGFSYFAWQTVQEQQTLRAITLSQSQSIDTLASSIREQGENLESMTSSVQTINATLSQLTARLDKASGKLDADEKEIQHLEARLSRLETSVSTASVQH